MSDDSYIDEIIEQLDEQRTAVERERLHRKARKWLRTVWERPAWRLSAGERRAEKALKDYSRNPF
jgi:hypothetical protein